MLPTTCSNTGDVEAHPRRQYAKMRSKQAVVCRYSTTVCARLEFTMFVGIHVLNAEKL